MQIIIDKATRTVLYADAALHLDAVCASNGAWVDHLTTTATAELLDVPALPAGWVPGAYTYSVAGAFEPAPPVVPVVVVAPPPGAILLPAYMPGGAT
ncbi:MAG: hypothetical protein AB7P37_03225 [Ramlibacter sp.]